MTINEIIENNNIQSDRYAMAAISCIFKAFGDSIRSKEYWPWGKDIQCEWMPSKGILDDIKQAELLLKRARVKYNEEEGKYKLISDKFISMFKIENVEYYLSNIKLNIPTYKIRINSLHYYEKEDPSKIYQLKSDDYLFLKTNDTYIIFKIINVNIETNEIIIEQVFGEYELNKNSIYSLNTNMYLQIYILENNIINDNINNNMNNQLKNLKRRLNKVSLGVKRINKTNSEIINVSENTNDVVNSIK